MPVDDLMGHLEADLLQLFLEMKHGFSISFDQPVGDPIDAAPSFADFFNLAELPIKRLVKMAKFLSPFMTLTQDDQIALLKGSVVATVTIRSAKLFNPSTSTWNVVRAGKEVNVNSMSLQMTNMAGMKLFSQYKELAESLVTVSHGDDGIMMLLIVLAVFDPDLDQVEQKDKVRDIRKKYMVLLNKYISIKYQGEKDMYSNVLLQLDKVNEVRNSHSHALHRTTPDKLQPLIMEIFDMSKYST